MTSRDTTSSMFRSVFRRIATQSMNSNDTTSSMFRSDTTRSMFRSNTTSTINSRFCSGASKRTETCNIPLFQSTMLTCYSQVPPRFRLQQSTFLGISSLFLDLRSKSFFRDFMYLFFGCSNKFGALLRCQTPPPSFPSFVKKFMSKRFFDSRWIFVCFSSQE